MKRSLKYAFFMIALLVLIVGLGASCAADVDNSTADASWVSAQVTHEDSSDISTDDSSVSKVEKTGSHVKDVKNSKQLKSVDRVQSADDYKSLESSWNDIRDNGSDGSDYVINVKSGNYDFDSELVLNQSSYVRHVIVNGEDVDRTIFNGQGVTRLFNLNQSSLSVSFSNITFINGFNNRTSGAIYSSANLSIVNCKFVNNSVCNPRYSVQGGAIQSLGNISIFNSSFIGNSARIANSSTMSGANGGAISFGNKNSFAVLNVSDCLFVGNREFTDNMANSFGGYGGAIYTIDRSSSFITYSSFINNSAVSQGGAVYINRIYNNTPCVVSHNYFVNNSANSKPDFYRSWNGDISNSDLTLNYYENDVSENRIVLLVNSELPCITVNQKTKRVVIRFVGERPFEDVSIDGIGKNYVSYITSSNSSLINTSGLKLSGRNNYTVSIDIRGLPEGHEDVVLYADGVECAVVKWDYTNVEFNNVLSKPGRNVTFKAVFSTSDGKLIPGGLVAFKINGKTIGHSNIKFGSAALNYSIPGRFSAKNYTLTVTYGGSGSRFIGVRSNATLSLNKLNTRTVVTTSKPVAGSNMQITVNTTDEDNRNVYRGRVALKINGKTIKHFNTTGISVVNYKLPKSWSNRDIIITSVYGENSAYNGNRVNLTVHVQPSTGKGQIKSVNSVKYDSLNNYYVSDTIGSDSNTGTSDSPFKTIAKAISIVNSSRTPANIYLSGDFRGAGNTNLTVPGNLHINFIGLGNSSIDGEVNYTIKEKLDDGEYYWNSGRIWWPYLNGTGNWAMNITRGSGLITISNLTVKNCWSPGGNSISTYPTATVDNYGNLAVNNVSFIFNHGGVGSSIRNNNESTVVINNSLFEGNRKSSSTGNEGAGLYNNGTATIINSTFRNNYARWGTVTNDRTLTIINSTICDNIAYDGGSTYKFGSGIAINTRSGDYFSDYDVNGISTVISGCTFINNDQLDVYADAGNLNLTNNVFNKSTGVYVPSEGTNYTLKYNIINNTFISPVGSTLFNSLSSKEVTTFAIKIRNAYTYLIENNTILNVTGTYSKSIELDGDNNINYAIIRNNTVDREIVIEGEYNNITGNNVTTKLDTYAVNLNDKGNNTIKDNYLVSKTFQGDNAVNYTQSSTIVENNTPKTTLITIDDNTYSRYFENNTLKSNYNTVDEIQVVGSLTNKNIIFNRNINFFQTDKKITSYNITITTANNTIITNGIIIENTNKQPVFILNTDNNTITGTNLKTNNKYTIIINGTNNKITGNELIADILVGDNSVNTAADNTINANTPTYTNYILSQETYNNYFDTDGHIKNINADNIHFLVNGTITNKNIILDNNKTITITKYSSSKLVNTTITTLGTTTLNMSNITVNNNNSRPALILNTKTNIITENNIKTNTNAIEAANVANLTIEHNNITANSTGIIKTIIIKDSTGKLSIQYNNIYTNGLAAQITNTTTSIEVLNTSQLVLSNNNITTIYTKTSEKNDTIISVNLMNPEINLEDLDTTGTNYNEISDNNIYTAGNTNAIGINYVNQTVYTEEGVIRTEAKTSAVGTRFITSKARHYYRYGSVTVYGLEDMTFKSASPGYQIILINSQNMRIYNNDITANTSKTDGIITYNTINTLIQNNRINTPGTPVKLVNSTETNITGNIIITTKDNTIIIQNTSTKNIITKNTLYAREELSDDSVLILNNNNRVRQNNPQTNTYLYLRDDTYNDYFDENGRLRNEVPTGITIRLTGDLHNKILNITRPINIISENTKYINCTIIIDKKAAKTNITGAIFTGENPNLTINADNTNINITDFTVSNTNSRNLTPVIINGNNNKLNITGTISVITEAMDKNTNATLITINGNNNMINSANNREPGNANNLTVILLNNSNNNNISLGWINIHSNILNQVIFLNANHNYLNIRQADVNGENFTGILMDNSSYNKMGYIRMNGVAENHTQLIYIKNNSDNNYFEQFTASTFGRNTIQNTAVIIENSNNNTIYRSQITYTNYDGYIIEIKEGVGNKIEYNQLQSRTLTGYDTILQENKNETINNIIRYNYAKAGRPQTFKINTTNTAKVLETITITTNSSYRNGSSYRLPLIPVEIGTVTYTINGIEIGTIDITNGITSINYTVTGNEGPTLTIEATYKDPTQQFSLTTGTVTCIVEKLNTSILVGNVANNGRDAILTAIVSDENMNIVKDGQVVFMMDGKVAGASSISNGVAVFVMDVSRYSAGLHDIRAVYSENNIYTSVTGSGVLNISRYNACISIDSMSARPGETVLFKVHVNDINGNAVNSGKVVFKINGKTLKDEHGNVITVRVHNGLAVLNYTIPSNCSAKNYTLTAVSVGNTYNRVNASVNLAVNKIGSYIAGSAVISNNTLIVNASLRNSLTGGVACERSCKVSVKVDGHTVIRDVRVSNGIINLNTVLNGVSSGVHTVEVVSSGNNIYNNSRVNMTVVKV